MIPVIERAQGRQMAAGTTFPAGLFGYYESFLMAIYAQGWEDQSESPAAGTTGDPRSLLAFAVQIERAISAKHYVCSKPPSYLLVA